MGSSKLLIMDSMYDVGDHIDLEIIERLGLEICLIDSEFFGKGQLMLGFTHSATDALGVTLPGSEEYFEELAKVLILSQELPGQDKDEVYLRDIVPYKGIPERIAQFSCMKCGATFLSCQHGEVDMLEHLWTEHNMVCTDWYNWFYAVGVISDD